VNRQRVRITPDSNMPTFRGLGLGAGVQSTTLALMAAWGLIEPIDFAIFADTGAEPAAVYIHLDRLEREVLTPAGIPVYHVSVGNIMADALGLSSDSQYDLGRPAGRFASMPLYVQNEPGPCEPCKASGEVDDDIQGRRRCGRCAGTGIDPGHGILPRQCTPEYKLAAIKAKTRELLTGSPDGRVSKGLFVETLIGFSADEVGRIKDSDVQYQSLTYPLIYDKRMVRADCIQWLEKVGWGSTPRSACKVCPAHGDVVWRDMRDNRPDEWAEAVAFDYALREHSVYTHGPAKITGKVYLHRSRMPLDQAPIDIVTRRKMRAAMLKVQTSIFGALAEAELEHGDPDGCSPWGCRSGEPIKTSP